jgi:predicted dehydrogenase
VSYNIPVAQFTRRSLLTAAPFVVRDLISKPRLSTLRLAAFGADGMAFLTLDPIAQHPKVKLVCVAEVDSAKTGQVKRKYPDARIYQDWREMVAKERRNVDMCCVGTPDHMHAPQAMSAMQWGWHVYQQKPMAHDLHEVRQLALMARRKKLVTQMGIQVHSRIEYRTVVALIRSGAIGKIKEVHSWSEKKWGDTEPLPEPTEQAPASLNWDHWLGVASPRPYIRDVYHPVNWRKRLDFGTATFGDMGCHILDPVFASVGLTAPISVRSEGPAPNRQSWALNSLIHYVFPGTPLTEGKTIAVNWYDGDERPPQEVQALVAPRKIPGQGSIFIGTKGAVLLPHTAMPSLFPEDQFKSFELPKAESTNHYHQFVNAVLGDDKATTSFDYAGPLTEAVLLGPLATRFPKTTLEWNSGRLKFRNSPEADRFVRRTYRTGWEVKGLS